MSPAMFPWEAGVGSIGVQVSGFPAAGQVVEEPVRADGIYLPGFSKK